MTAAERLVNQIRDFINRVDHQATPEIHELARQLHELSSSLHERLAQCRDFLRKGMRSEAVQEALARPSVFELAEALSFEEQEKWQELCRKLGLTQTAKVELETIEYLKAECGKETLMEPLLQEFRRLIHTGSRDQIIHVLHRIRSHDPANPVWNENLEPLEREQIKELEKQAEQAMSEDDTEQVSAILTSLKAPYRVLDPPRKLVVKMQDWLRGKREKAATEEALRLLEQLGIKLGEKNEQAVAALLKAWQRLLQYPDFKPTPEMVAVTAQATNWRQSEANRKLRRKEFENKLGNLQDLLRYQSDAWTEIEKQWQELRGFDQSPPEALHKAVEASRVRRQELENKRKKRHLTITAVATAIILVLLAAGGWAACASYRNYQVRQKLARLWNQERYHDLTAYLQQLEEKPGRYRATQAATYRERLATRQHIEQQRQQRWEQLNSRLLAVRASGYQTAPEEVKALLDEAKELADTQAERDQVADWSRHWQQWRNDQQAQRDLAFAAHLDQIEADLRAIETPSPDDLSTRLNRLLELHQQYREKLELADRVSTGVMERYRELGQRISQQETALRQKLSQHLAQQQQHDRLLARIPQTAGHINQWEEAISDFLEAFPEAALSHPLAQAKAQATMARDAVAITPFRIRRLPLGELEITRLETMIRQLPAGRQSAWRAPLEMIIAHSLRQARVTAQIRRIREVDFYDLQQIQVREIDRDEWKTYYIPGVFHHREYPGEEAPVTRYWGPVYGLNPSALTATTEHLSISSDTHEVRFSNRDDENLIPSAQYIRQFLVRLPDDHRLLDFLLEEMDRLRLDQTMELVPKAKIISILGNAIADFNLSENELSNQYRNIFNGLRFDLPWFNQENQVIRENQKAIARRIADLPGSERLGRQLHFNRELLLASVNRDLACVGLLWPDPDSNQPQPVFQSNPLRTVWILQPIQEGNSYQFMELNLDPDHKLPPAQASEMAGQLLFAPADQRTAKELLQDLPPPPETDQITWPASWPVNTRRLP